MCNTQSPPCSAGRSRQTLRIWPLSADLTWPPSAPTKLPSIESRAPTPLQLPQVIPLPPLEAHRAPSKEGSWFKSEPTVLLVEPHAAQALEPKLPKRIPRTLGPVPLSQNNRPLRNRDSMAREGLERRLAVLRQSGEEQDKLKHRVAKISKKRGGHQAAGNFVHENARCIIPSKTEVDMRYDRRNNAVERAHSNVKKQEEQQEQRAAELQQQLEDKKRRGSIARSAPFVAARAESLATKCRLWLPIAKDAGRLSFLAKELCLARTVREHKKKLEMAAIAIQASFRSKWWRKTKAAKIRRGFERIRRWIARWQENNTRERKLQAAKVMCSFLSSCCKGTRVLNTVKKLRFHVKQLQRFWRSYAGWQREVLRRRQQLWTEVEAEIQDDWLRDRTRLAGIVRGCSKEKLNQILKQLNFDM
eukprot:TRINITY_DN97_c0_g1_i13.p1 TRINITY_DN97_c0_g1~~TRINITY_DN97_c0_g1_i13.p1  ORF type:complete len:417 (+),score=87.78 TRINITY_DN97_c0_g1_i13:215-1465(+)